MVVNSIRDDSKRERFLLVLFPSALILAVYSVMFAFGLQKEHSNSVYQLNETKKKRVDPDAAADAKVKYEREKTRLEELKQRMVDSRQQIRDLSSGWRLKKDRLQNLRHLTEVMDYHDLSIVSQGGESSVVLSSYLQDLFQVMENQGQQDSVQPWPVEVKGRYFNVMAFLAEVTKSPSHMIPVAVTMEPESEGSSSDTKTWTIIFAI